MTSRKKKGTKKHLILERKYYFHIFEYFANKRKNGRLELKRNLFIGFYFFCRRRRRIRWRREKFLYELVNLGWKPAGLERRDKLWLLCMAWRSNEVTNCWWDSEIFPLDNFFKTLSPVKNFEPDQMPIEFEQRMEYAQKSISYWIIHNCSSEGLPHYMVVKGQVVLRHYSIHSLYILLLL